MGNRKRSADVRGPTLEPPSYFKSWLVESRPSNALSPDAFPLFYTSMFSSLLKFPPPLLSLLAGPTVLAFTTQGCETF